jgi:putative SOS response-associated peptidase YedK
MCGRYVVTKPVFKTEKIVKKTIGVENDDNYNAHPQQKLPVIKQYTNGKH